MLPDAFAIPLYLITTLVFTNCEDQIVIPLLVHSLVLVAREWSLSHRLLVGCLAGMTHQHQRVELDHARPAPRVRRSMRFCEAYIET